MSQTQRAPREMELLRGIARRGTTILAGRGVKEPFFNVLMDVVSVHDLVVPLRLEEMAVARDQDLIHDIVGIRRHLDRRNFSLTSGFHPRYARV